MLGNTTSEVVLPGYIKEDNIKGIYDTVEERALLANQLEEIEYL